MVGEAFRRLSSDPREGCKFVNEPTDRRAEWMMIRRWKSRRHSGCKSEREVGLIDQKKAVIDWGPC